MKKIREASQLICPHCNAPIDRNPPNRSKDCLCPASCTNCEKELTAKEVGPFCDECCRYVDAREEDCYGD